MLRLFFFIFFAISSCCALAQQSYLFRHIGVNDGLATEQTIEARQDANGFIWIATTNGLQRYDGNRFLSFHHSVNDPRSIPSDKVFQLQVDKKNRLWMICHGENTGYFDVNDFTYHEVPVKAKAGAFKNRYRRIQLDNDGNIILVVEKINTYTYNEAKNEFATEYNPFPLPEGWKLMYLHQDKPGNNYWLGCDSGLAKYAVKEKTLYYRGHNENQDPVINAYGFIRSAAFPYLDQSGRFWIYSWPLAGPGPFLLSYDLKQKKTTSWDGPISKTLHNMYHEVFDIGEAQDGTVWIAGENLLVSIDTAGSSFHYYANNLPGEFSIRYDVARGLMQDREHNIWVCTNKGVYRFNPSMQLFNTIANKRPGKDSAYTSDVTDILQANTGEIIVSTWGNGLFAYDSVFRPVNKNYITPSLEQREGLTWCIYQRSNGDIWRGNQDGYIFIYHAATGKNEKLRPPVFANSTIRQIEEDNAGHLWIGTQNGHLIKWNAVTNTFSHVLDLKSVIHRLYKDDRGNLWACTTMQGLYKINTENGTIEKQYTAKGPAGKRLTADVAVDIVQYNDSLYMIAGEGLNILNIRDDSILHFTREKGLPSNETTNIAKDHQGILWITAETGLVSFDFKNEVLSAYGAEAGIQTSSFHEASINVLKDGRVAIGTVHDFVVFNPEKINKGTTTPPDVQITGFALSNKWLPMDSIRKLYRVDLPYDQTSVIIEFSMLTYFSKYGVSYMLEGVDKDWISAGFTDQVVYNSLAPGKYVFKVRGENGKNIYSKHITEFWIRVRTPFWQSWWFYSILGLIIAGLLYWFDRERVNRIRTVFQTRASIAGNLHTEVNAALSNINVLSEIARMKADSNPEQTKDYITQIHDKSHNMIIAMDDMLWSIDPSNDGMAKMVDRMKEFADALHNRHNRVIDLKADPEIFALKPDMKTRHELMIIYKQALRLFIEQLKADHTVIQLDYSQSSFLLNIFSGDVVMPENNDKPVAKAVEEMKNRALNLAASFDIHSDGKGTVLSVGLKL